MLAFVFRFFLLQFRYISQIEHPTPPLLDIAAIILYALCLLWSTLGTFVVTPRTLDSWTTIAWLLNIVPLVLDRSGQATNLIAHRTFIVRLLCCLSVRHFWLACCLNSLHLLIVIVRLDQSTFSEDRSVHSTMHVATLVLAYAFRQQIYANVSVGFDLKTSATGLDAASRLLNGFCDAVVELDDTLKVRGNVKQFSTMLLHENSSGSVAENSSFVSFFSPADREHVERSLRSDDGHAIPQALHAKILDSMSNALSVELLHVRFRKPSGLTSNPS